MEPSVAIRANNLSKCFSLYGKPSDMLKELVFQKPLHTVCVALDNISFEIEKGQVVGILGRNGAGKSTLLKILAGTLDKTSGDIAIDGKISAILELGAGFNPLYTGRENISMGGMVLGMSPDEIEQKKDWIIDFSELRDVIDHPFNTYSSGMQARLTFAVAVSVDPDIFMVDEALAAGDAYFVSKSLGRIKQICKSGSTVLIVSHSSNLIMQLCDKAIWLDHGQIRRFGDPLSVVREYDYEVHVSLAQGKGEIIELVSHEAKDVLEPAVESSGIKAEAIEKLPGKKRIFRAGPVMITQVLFLDSEGKPTTSCRRWGKMTVQVHYQCQGEIPKETLGLAVSINRSGDFLPVSQISTINVQEDGQMANYHQESFRTRAGETGIMECIFDPVQLAEGDYYFSVGLLPNISGSVEFYEYHHYAYKISILRSGFPLTGLVYYPLIRWSHRANDQTDAV